MNKYKNPALILLVACLSLAIGFQGWLAVSSKFGSKVEAFAIIFLIEAVYVFSPFFVRGWRLVVLRVLFYLITIFPAAANFGGKSLKIISQKKFEKQIAQIQAGSFVNERIASLEKDKSSLREQNKILSDNQFDSTKDNQRNYYRISLNKKELRKLDKELDELYLKYDQELKSELKRKKKLAEEKSSFDILIETFFFVWIFIAILVGQIANGMFSYSLSCSRVVVEKRKNPVFLFKDPAIRKIFTDCKNVELKKLIKKKDLTNSQVLEKKILLTNHRQDKLEDILNKKYPEYV